MKDGKMPTREPEAEEEKVEEGEEENYNQSASKFVIKKLDDEECDKLMCKRAGWCMCD